MACEGLVDYALEQCKKKEAEKLKKKLEKEKKKKNRKKFVITKGKDTLNAKKIGKKVLTSALGGLGKITAGALGLVKKK